MINGSYRKRWNYHSISPLFDFYNSNNPSFIEGIGNKFGLFEGLQNFINLYSNLFCHSVNNITLYGNSTCNLITGVNELVLDSSVVYPNPFTTQIYIENSKVKREVIITDISGKKVYQNFKERSSIDLSFLEVGIYFITISTEKGLVTQKIVKQ